MAAEIISLRFFSNEKNQFCVQLSLFQTSKPSLEGWMEGVGWRGLDGEGWIERVG